MIRIIAGAHKGAKLQFAPAVTRPSAQRHKQRLFDCLQHRLLIDFHGMRIGDFFAGSGALGLEAVSRGAKSVFFLERSSRACRFLALNAQKMQPGAQFHLENAAAQPGLAKLLRNKHTKGRFFPLDLAFFDPPYAFTTLAPFVGALIKAELFATDALLAFERPLHRPPLDLAPHFLLAHQIKGSIACWDLYSKEAAQHQES